MGVYYFARSALVKRSTQAVGSPWGRGRTDAPVGNAVFTALMTGGESVAALARRARRRLIAWPEAMATTGVCTSHCTTQSQRVLTTAAMVEHAMDLAEQHGRRGYDAVQLASACAVQTELTTSDVGQCVFVSAEAHVHQAAQAQGRAGEHPHDHP